MDRTRSHFLRGALAGVLGTLLLALLVALGVAYTGAYNVAASSGHTAGWRWLLDTTMHASVRSRADEGESQARLARADVAAGASEYKAMCEHCHGGPGVEPAGWSRGMLPRPPHMTEAAREWKPAEVVWIVRHGVKYTGMPSFGEGHDEVQLWNIAAFVKDLPAMTPEAYRRYGPADAGHHGSGTAREDRAGDHHGHAH